MQVPIASLLFFRGLAWKCEIKSRSLPDSGFGPDGTSVSANDAFDGGQANAGPFKFFRSMEPLEYAEQFVGVLHIKADTIIANEYGQIAIFLNGPHFDNRDGSRPRILRGIGQQISEHL